jgi:hypothetical protein
MVSRRSGYLVLLSALLPLVLISPCLCKPSGNARAKSKWNSGRRGLAIFVPTLGQRQLLRDIQVTAEALRRIEPDPSAGWDRQVQKLLLSQQVFGIGDPEKAFAEGKVRLERLIGQAKSSGIPANVVESNVAQGDVPEMKEEEE